MGTVPKKLKLPDNFDTDLPAVRPSQRIARFPRTARGLTTVLNQKPEYAQPRYCEIILHRTQPSNERSTSASSLPIDN